MLTRCLPLLIYLFASLGMTACSSEPETVNSRGAEVVKTTCKVCHAQGINGAPILGNARMWQSRLAQGQAVLVQHATEGYGLMPAKGGNDALSEADIDAAVEHMLSLLAEAK